MRSILLQMEDSVDTQEVVSVLQPFGTTITLMPVSDKTQDDTMAWLGKIYRVNAAIPLKRSELYDR